MTYAAAGSEASHERAGASASSSNILLSTSSGQQLDLLEMRPAMRETREADKKPHRLAGQRRDCFFDLRPVVGLCFGGVLLQRVWRVELLFGDRLQPLADLRPDCVRILDNLGRNNLGRESIGLLDGVAGSAFRPSPTLRGPGL